MTYVEYSEKVSEVKVSVWMGSLIKHPVTAYDLEKRTRYICAYQSMNQKQQGCLQIKPIFSQNNKILTV